MDPVIQAPANDAAPDLDAEAALWDWARPAGVSAEELRQALRAALVAPQLRKAA
jgi:hypothetical protein